MSWNAGYTEKAWWPHLHNNGRRVLSLMFSAAALLRGLDIWCRTKEQSFFSNVSYTDITDNLQQWQNCLFKCVYLVSFILFLAPSDSLVHFTFQIYHGLGRKGRRAVVDKNVRMSESINSAQFYHNLRCSKVTRLDLGRLSNVTSRKRQSLIYSVEHSPVLARYCG